MQRFLPWLMVAMALVLPACVSSTTLETTNEFAPVQEGARIIVLEPDVQLSFLRASGLREARADWTESGRALMLEQMQKQLAARDHTVIVRDFDPNDDDEVQLIKLHEAVGSTILVHRFLRQPLPSKKKQFDWSLGPGVSALADGQDADYALFLFARGAYASAGRQVLNAVLAVGAGQLIGTGDQQAFASLIDMKTGDIVWFNVTTTGSGIDMRKEEGAERVVSALFRKLPL